MTDAVTQQNLAVGDLLRVSIVEGRPVYRVDTGVLNTENGGEWRLHRNPRVNATVVPADLDRYGTIGVRRVPVINMNLLTAGVTDLAYVPELTPIPPTQEENTVLARQPREEAAVDEQFTVEANQIPSPSDPTPTTSSKATLEDLTTPEFILSAAERVQRPYEFYWDEIIEQIIRKEFGDRADDMLKQNQFGDYSDRRVDFLSFILHKTLTEGGFFAVQFALKAMLEMFNSDLAHSGLRRNGALTVALGKFSEDLQRIAKESTITPGSARDIMGYIGIELAKAGVSKEVIDKLPKDTFEALSAAFNSGARRDAIIISKLEEELQRTKRDYEAISKLCASQESSVRELRDQVVSLQREKAALEIERSRLYNQSLHEYERNYRLADLGQYLTSPSIPPSRGYRYYDTGTFARGTDRPLYNTNTDSTAIGTAVPTVG